MAFCAVVRAEQPNILWITAEDMSATLGCYGDEYATTPNIDRFAKQSVRYTKAFASAPVCSPSRSCLITGCYPPSLSTQQMRSGFAIPKGMRGFPARLRAHGFYTSNNVKTDYNTGNYADMAKAFGGYGERVTDPNEIVSWIGSNFNVEHEEYPKCSGSLNEVGFATASATPQFFSDVETAREKTKRTSGLARFACTTNGWKLSQAVPSTCTYIPSSDLTCGKPGFAGSRNIFTCN